MALRLDSNRVVQRAPPQDLWQPHVKSEPVLQEMPEAFGSKTTLSFKERYIGISQSRLRAPGTRHVGNNRGGGGGTPNFDTPLRISCEFLESIGSGSVFCPRRDVIKGERYSGTDELELQRPRWLVGTTSVASMPRAGNKSNGSISPRSKRRQKASTPPRAHMLPLPLAL
jgi:hypothetical protein